MMQRQTDERQQPALRIADSDREHTIACLREHCVAGRLTLDELSGRIRSVYDARTQADLDAITQDLPAIAPVASSANFARSALRKATRWTVACLSSETRKGRWRLDEQTSALAFMGTCILDLRQVALNSPEVSITAIAIMGTVDIIVPEGVEVDLSGFSFMGSKDCRTNDALIHPGAPLIRVQGYSLMGTVTVKSKPSMLTRLWEGLSEK
jgi:hypothetical protein